jgi:hypothetical protein
MSRCPNCVPPDCGDLGRTSDYRIVFDGKSGDLLRGQTVAAPRDADP